MKLHLIDPVQLATTRHSESRLRNARLIRSTFFALVFVCTAFFGTGLAHAEEEPEAACAPATETTAECLSIIVPEGAFPSYQGSGEKGGFARKDFLSAYKFPATGGSTQTIAIVDAFDDPNAESDLSNYRSHYGLSECTTANGCFKKVNQKGETKNYPPPNSGWSLEVSLDLDMVSAICPECHILLVEATSNSFANMATAEDQAATLKATEISDSWGGGDSEARAAENSHYNHPGIPILVSSGDSGYGTAFPASVPSVIAVGGTSLKTAANSREWSEAVWSGAGSGCSGVQSKPAWQTDAGCAKRTDTDVSAVAAPETPVSVYDSYVYGGWLLVGGTSASAPILAGVEALSSSLVREMGAEALWKAGTAGHLFDVTEGNNGSCGGSYLCTAKVGYDGPTGWGTPNGEINITSKPPENVGLPTVTPLAPDQAVPESTTNGIWTGEPFSYTYQWQRCNATGGECTAITGASTSIYTPVAADVGHTLIANVTATNGTGSNTAASKATNKVKPTGEITEYAAPSNCAPWGITNGPDGNVWYTCAAAASRIAKITTTGTSTEYALPKNSEPTSITAGPDGNLWFTDTATFGGKSNIGKISTTGTITEYALPEKSSPASIVVGPDKNLWFPEYNVGKIGKIATSGVITEYPVTKPAGAIGITSGPDGNLWFTAWEGNKIGKISTSGTVTEFALPAGSRPNGITTGPDGNLWFVNQGTNKVGKITTAGSITEYFLPAGSQPRRIATGADGNLWFTNRGTSKIGKITTSGSRTEYALPSGSEPQGITSGPDNSLWYTNVLTGKIGAIVP
jgi:streptogramin lyase